MPQKTPTRKTASAATWRSAFAGSAVALMLAISPSAHATGLIAGATEFTQIANNIELVMNGITEAEQLATQYQQYSTQMQNLKKLAGGGPAMAGLFRDMVQNQQMFKRLASVVENGQRIAYSLESADAAFKRQYPGYGNMHKGYGAMAKGMSDNTLGAINSAVSAVGLQADQIDSESEMVGELSRLSGSADGQLAATQAGNQISVAMVGQMQKMRQLQMAQMQAQNAHMAGQQTKQDVSDDALRQFLSQNQLGRVRSIKELKNVNPNTGK